MSKRLVPPHLAAAADVRRSAPETSSGGTMRCLPQSLDRGVIRIARLKKIRNDTTATTAAAVNAMPRKNFSVINARNAATRAENAAF